MNTYMGKNLIRWSLVSLVMMAIVTCSFRTYTQNIEPGAQGKVVADSRFRSQPNGFKFQNWGGEDYPHGKLTADDVRCLIGDQVCARFEDNHCIPTPAAKLWIDQMNQIMTGGHCEGMAALSTAFFTNQENIQGYGRSTSFDLDTSNAVLLRTISAYFTTQAIEPIASATAKTRDMSLADILKVLTEAMRTQQEIYTLGLYGPQGGHAVTPYAVEELGTGQFRIYVYDNNYPATTNFIEVDTAANAWRYPVAALNPSEGTAVWEGASGAMDLTPLSLRLQPLSCPFCEDPQPTKPPQGCRAQLVAQELQSTKPQPTKKPKPAATPKPARTPEKKPQSAQQSDKQPQSKPIAQPKNKPAYPPQSPKKSLGGVFAIYTDLDCDQLSAIDKRTRKQIRIENGKMNNQISGATMTMIKGSTGCYMKLPTNADYDIRLNGDSGAGTESASIAIFQPGISYNISDLELDPAQHDLLTIGDDALSYVPGEQNTLNIKIATDRRQGADALYNLDEIVLGAGFHFTILEKDSGGLSFDSDDPDLDSIDLEVTISTPEGDETYEMDDLAFGDDEEGQIEIEIGDDGQLDMGADDGDDSGEDDPDAEDSGDDSGDDDSGSDDSGSEDSGSDDSGSDDSGSEDSGSDDSGSDDSGSEDSGSGDSGSDESSEE